MWHAITQLVLGADNTAPDKVLRQRAALMLVSRDVAAATRGVPLRLDLRSATDTAAVKALLCAAPVAALWLGRGVAGDELLRDPAVRALSGACSKRVVGLARAGH